MKITSASKKVLCSALSAAMVVAFAPTVAFATDLGGGPIDDGTAPGEAIAIVTYGNNMGEKFSADGKGLQEAFDFAVQKGGTVKLLDNVTADVTVNGKVTLDLNGFAWTNASQNLYNKSNSDNAAASPITLNKNAAAVISSSAKLVAAPKADYPIATAGTAWAATATANTGNNHMIMSSAELEGLTKNAGEGTAATAVGQVVSNYNAASKTYDGVVTVAANTVAEINDVLYKANGADTAWAEGVTYYFVATSNVTAGAGQLTIKDSSAEKTGSIDGVETITDANGNVAKVAYPVVAVGATGSLDASLTIEGGKFTTGSADISKKVTGGNTIADLTNADSIKAFGIEVASIKNASVEVTGGTYVAGTATKGQTVDAVEVAGTVKESSIKAVTGDYGTAVALKAMDAIEKTTVEATAGAAAKGGNNSSATAIEVPGAVTDTAVTYKQVVATAIANGSSENGTNSAATAIKVNDKYTVTINSGSFTGERVKVDAGKLSLKGGEYSKHIVKDAGVAADVADGYDTVCLGEGKSDFVYKKADATVTFKGAIVPTGNGNDVYSVTTGKAGALSDFIEEFVAADATDEQKAALAKATSQYAIVSAANEAYNHAFAAAISGSNDYQVGVAYAGEYSADELAAIVTDADAAEGLALGIDVFSGTAAEKVTAPATLTDAQVDFNKVVEAADAAAKADNKVAFGYVNITAAAKYTKAGALKAEPAFSLTDLGLKDKDADQVNHGTATVGTQANSIDLSAEGVKELFNTDYICVSNNELTTATKSAAVFGTVDGDKIAAMEQDSKTKNFKLTKLGGYTVVAANGETAADKPVEPSEPVTPDTPAVEKSTQTITVAKKTKTVTLGAKKTKTAKSKSINLDPAAETDVTAAWKSGSTKITVTSAGKVKLAKGVKRGTYTAKVTLKAGASDAYYAASKTITVKFTIK